MGSSDGEKFTVVLVKRMQEDLEYLRKHAMSDPNRNKDKKLDAATTPQDDTTHVE